MLLLSWFFSSSLSPFPSALPHPNTSHDHEHVFLSASTILSPLSLLLTPDSSLFTPHSLPLTLFFTCSSHLFQCFIQQIPGDELLDIRQRLSRGPPELRRRPRLKKLQQQVMRYLRPVGIRHLLV